MTRTEQSAPEPSRRLRTSTWVLLILLALPIVGLGVQALRVVTYPTAYDGQNADCAIVLGAAVWHHVPSPVFAERIHFGVELALASHVRFLVFTGGVGEHGMTSEARVGADEALRRGVAPERILLEEASHKTWGNLQNARQVIRERGLQRCYLVSDAPHLLRAVTMARRLGMDVRPAATPTSRIRSWQARVTFAVSEAWYLKRFLLLPDTDESGRRDVNDAQ